MHQNQHRHWGKTHIGRGAFFRKNWVQAQEAVFHEINGTLSEGEGDNLSPMTSDGFTRDHCPERQFHEQDVAEDVTVVLGMRTPRRTPGGSNVSPNLLAPAAGEHIKDVRDVKAKPTLWQRIRCLVNGTCEKTVHLLSAGQVMPNLEGHYLLVDISHLIKDSDTFDVMPHAGCHPAIKKAAALMLSNDAKLLKTIRSHVQASEQPHIVFRYRDGADFKMPLALLELIAECLWLSEDVTDVREEYLTIKSWPTAFMRCFGRLTCIECAQECQEASLVTDRYLSLATSGAPSLGLTERQRLSSKRTSNFAGSRTRRFRMSGERFLVQ